MRDALADLGPDAKTNRRNRPTNASNENIPPSSFGVGLQRFRGQSAEATRAVAVERINMAFKTDDGAIRKLLTNPGKFIIPPYQRQYSWDRQQWRSLWEAVLSLYARLGGAKRFDRGSGHFIGTFVYGEGETAGPTSRPEYDVIDGQQRVVTLSLLIAALRDSIAAGHPLRDEIDASFLVHPAMGGQSKQLRIEPGRKDLPIYESVVFGSSIGASQHLVARGYRFFREQILLGVVPPMEGVPPDDVDGVGQIGEGPPDGSSAEEGAPAVDPLKGEPFDDGRLLLAIVDGLEFVSIGEVAPESAYQVFSTINAEGTKLSQIDLLRNAYFLLLPTRAAELHERAWVPMEDLLGSRLEDFFHTDLLRQGRDITKRDIYREQTLLLREMGRDEEHIAKELVQIMERAQLYHTLGTAKPPIIVDQRRLPGEAEESLQHLNAWGADPVFPLILETALRWKASKLSDSSLSTILRAIESLLVRRYIVGVPPNDLRSAFSSLMRQVKNSSDFVADVQKELRSPRLRWRSDEEVAAALQRTPFYRPKPRYAGLILKWLAESSEGKECPTISIGTGASDFSVEHILPQDLNSVWREDLASWGVADPTEMHAQEKDLIGNLTLTAYNSELASRSFAEKKRLIAEKLRLRLSTEVLEADRWTAEQIDARSTRLAKAINEQWPLLFSNADGGTTSESSTASNV
jgi:uncharacterized protein with ParB-like and HNH nuclease domain